MRVFVTGATGYIGGAIAARLQQSGHEILGLVRSPEKAAQLRARGIEPVAGSLDDAQVVSDAAGRSDAVVNAANSDHRGVVEACLDAMAGSGKAFLQTSGTSIVADEAAGERSEKVFDEDTPFEPVPERRERVGVDRLVRSAAERNIRGIVLCNSLIYGTGAGLHTESVQVPTLVTLARRFGHPVHVGRGRNVWSNVHIEDVAELYALALERAPAGAFYFVENHEASFKEMADAVGRALGLGPARDWPVEDAIAELGRAKALFTFGSNSRVRGRRTRAELGWQPRHGSVLDWIAQAVR